MNRLHAIIVALVALIVVGASAWFIYDLYIGPRRALLLEEQRMQEEAAAKAAESQVDPGIAAFEETEKQAQGADPARARELWLAFLESHAASPKAAGARDALGALNSAGLFSAEPSPHKAIHTVAKGDSLYKISRKFGTSIELIARANSLSGTMLQIGQELVVPQVEISAAVDRESKTLTLQNHGEFFRAYPLLSARVPSLPEGSSSESSVLETIAEADGKRLVFGDKNYAEGKRSIILSGSGVAILSVPADTPAEEMPPGLVVAEPDMAEIFVLLRRGVPVTIK